MLMGNYEKEKEVLVCLKMEGYQLQDLLYSK